MGQDPTIEGGPDRVRHRVLWGRSHRPCVPNVRGIRECGDSRLFFLAWWPRALLLACNEAGDVLPSLSVGELPVIPVDNLL